MTVISPRSWRATWWPFASSPSASGGSMATSVRGCIASASTVVSVTPSATTASYSVRPGSNSPNSTPLSVSEARRASIASGMLYAVDAVVAPVGDVHDVAVGPEAARAVVAGPAQLAELLLADALELPGVVVRVLLAGVRLCIRQHGHAVGEEALRVVVGDPEGDAVGPDAAGVVVGGVELVLGEQVAAGDVVGEEGCPCRRPAPTSSRRRTRCRGRRGCVRRARAHAPRRARRWRGRRRRGGSGRCRRPTWSRRRTTRRRTRCRAARDSPRRGRTHAPRRARRT